MLAPARAGKAAPGWRQSVSASHLPNVAGLELIHKLIGLFPEEPAIVNAVIPLLESQDQELLAQRSREPHVVVVEALWVPSHQVKEITLGELTKRVNVLLRAREEIYVYSAKEIGWQLRHLGFTSRHNGKGKSIRFTREVRGRVHQLGAQFGLQLPKQTGCADCETSQLVAPG